MTNGFLEDVRGGGGVGFVGNSDSDVAVAERSVCVLQKTPLQIRLPIGAFRLFAVCAVKRQVVAGTVGSDAIFP